MTAIVGLEHKNEVYIGGDSAGVAGLSICIRKDPKVFINGEFIIGCTTSFRMIQLLQYNFDPPKQNDKQSDMKFMVVDFITAVRELFSNNGYTPKDKDGDCILGGQFLVGYRGKLYEINEDFQVGKPKLPYDAVGSGFDICLGSMFSTSKLDPKKRITTALKAASKFNAGVAPPFKILKLK